MPYTAAPNCICYRNGKCCHQASPRRVFGAAECILEYPPTMDPRIIRGCALKVENNKSKVPATPPYAMPPGYE